MAQVMLVIHSWLVPQILEFTRKEFETYPSWGASLSGSRSPESKYNSSNFARLSLSMPLRGGGGIERHHAYAVYSCACRTRLLWIFCKNDLASDHGHQDVCLSDFLVRHGKDVLAKLREIGILADL